MDIFNKICLQLDLGEILSEPLQLKGGFMHKMYSLFTTTGKYAIKLLNPYVMKRDTVFENYRIAEELEAKLEQTDIPILPALTFNGKKMQEIDGQYFYLFDFYEGKSLKGEEITIEHCRKIGEFLAKIHNIEKKAQPYNRSEINVDWNMLIEKLSANNTELHNLLSANRDILYESQQKGNLATKKIPSVLTICHNDMDSKNVLWNNGDNCRIIDLECLCYSSPFVELYEMALCWSGYENCNIDFNLFKALIKSYADNGGELPDDWETIYYSSYGRLEWLEYNVKRALGIDCGEDEIEMGISEVLETMEHIVYYHGVRDEIIECLKSLYGGWLMYNTKYCEVHYEEDYNVVFVRWKKYCCFDDYRKPLEYALGIIKNHNDCNYVADTRTGFENHPDDTKWVADVFIPTAVEYGCKIIYFIIDENNSLKDELEGQESDSSDKIEFKYIYSLNEIR